MEVVTRSPHKRKQTEELRPSRSPASAPSKMCNAPKTQGSLFIWSSPLTSRSCKQFSSSRPRRLFGGYFTHDAMRFFVIAQTFECGVTEKTIIGPLSKTDLRHQLWLQPAYLFHFFRRDAFAEMARATARQVGEWTFGR